MDIIWYSLGAFFEFIFELITPIGRSINILFVVTGFAGAIYWLWYDKHVEKGNHNYMSDSGKKNK
jgi:hypothetical protein